MRASQALPALFRPMRLTRRLLDSATLKKSELPNPGSRCGRLFRQEDPEPSLASSVAGHHHPAAACIATIKPPRVQAHRPCDRDRDLRECSLGRGSGAAALGDARATAPPDQSSSGCQSTDGALSAVRHAPDRLLSLVYFLWAGL